MTRMNESMSHKKDNIHLQLSINIITYTPMCTSKTINIIYTIPASFDKFHIQILQLYRILHTIIYISTYNIHITMNLSKLHVNLIWKHRSTFIICWDKQTYIQHNFRKYYTFNDLMSRIVNEMNLKLYK